MNPFNFWKFIQGFFPVSGEKTGKLIFYICMFTLCMFVYNKWIAPKNITQIHGEKVTVNQCKEVRTWGLEVGRIGVGLWSQ